MVRLPPRKTRCPLSRGQGGHQGRSGRVGKILHPPGFDLRTVQPVTSSYTEWAIPSVTGVSYLFLFRINSETYSFVHLVGIWIGSFQGLRLWRKHETISTHLCLIHLLFISLLYSLFTSFCHAPSFFLYFFRYLHFLNFLYIFIYVLFLVLSVFVSFFPSFCRPSFPADVFRTTALFLLIAETCLLVECT